MSKKTILLVVLVLVIGGALAAYLMGYLYVGAKQPDQRVSLTQAARPCGEAEVNRYNALSMPITESGQSDLKTLADDIKAKASSNEDATCQTILFFAGALTENKQMANDAYGNVERLHSKGVFADSRLHNIYSVDRMKETLSEMAG